IVRTSLRTAVRPEFSSVERALAAAEKSELRLTRASTMRPSLALAMLAGGLTIAARCAAQAKRIKANRLERGALRKSFDTTRPPSGLTAVPGLGRWKLEYTDTRGGNETPFPRNPEGVGL